MKQRPDSPKPAWRLPAVSPAAIIVVCVIALSLLGLTILFSASASNRQGPYFYLNKQLLGFGLAIGVCLVVSRINLDFARRYAWVIGGGLLLLLGLVLVPGIGVSVNGSRRWLELGPARFQVSELAKFAMIFCLAHYLALNQTRIGEWKRGFLYPLAIIGAFTILVVREPDFGTAVLLLAVGLLLLFLAGAKWRYLLTTVAGATALFAVLVANNPNRLWRLLGYLDLEANKDGSGYQLYQSLVAFAAGGVEGVGLGQGRQQINFLPEAHTDFIFAVVGEELGLWFTLSVVALFTIIYIAGLVHLRRAPNLFQFLLVAGALQLICLQALINLGVATGVLPTKGMSLPFISAGLSNLMLMAILVGIILNTQRTWGRAVLPKRVRQRAYGGALA